MDGKGLIIRGQHIVVVDNVQNSTMYHCMLGELLMMKEYPLFVSDSGDPKNYIEKYMTNVSTYMICRMIMWGLCLFVDGINTEACGHILLCGWICQ